MSAPRPSASVIILAPDNSVLLLHRGPTSPSFPSAHVFPGGNLDAFHDGPLPGASSSSSSLSSSSPSSVATATPPPPPPSSSAATSTDATALLSLLHSDGPAFRMAAVRECFEECGILLAKKKDGARDQKGDISEMLELDGPTREEGRRKVRNKEVTFGHWVDAAGGLVDTDNLIPFTRWITPITLPQRFTTQMYLYLLPLSSDSLVSNADTTTAPIVDADGDGGREVTSAVFAPASTWLHRARASQITLYPPQYYLLDIISQFTAPPAPQSRPLAISALSAPPPVPSPLNPASHQPLPPASDFAFQRTALLTHIHYPNPPPASPYPPSSPLSPAVLNPRGTALARIPPGRRVICPRTLFVRSSDGCVVLGLDDPGPELQGTLYSDLEDEDNADGACVERGGDGQKVVLIAFDSGSALKNVEVRSREEVIREERERPIPAASASLAAEVGMTGMASFGRKI